MSGTKKTQKESERKGSRVTVRLSEAEVKRLDAIRAATDDRPALQRATVLRAALADMTAEAYARDDVMASLVEPVTSSGACDRVHLDDATAHALVRELSRIGTNLNQIARRMNENKFDVIARPIVSADDSFNNEYARFELDEDTDDDDDELSLREQVVELRKELVALHDELRGAS